MAQYHMSLNELADCRELIPEMFYLPDTYINRREINFGTMMNGVTVNHIELPSWTQTLPPVDEHAKGNPFVYVAKMYETLESEQVRASINKWLDLIFGKKARGEEAKEALNIYAPLTYEENQTFEDIPDNNPFKTQIYNFG